MPARILVCLRYGIGDIVMQTPVLAALRRAYPRATIVGIGAAPAIELLREDFSVDALETSQRFGFTHWGDPGGETARAALREWLLTQSFDLVLDASHAVAGVKSVIRELRLEERDAGGTVQRECLRECHRAVPTIQAASRRAWAIEIPERVPRLRWNKHDEAAACRALHDNKLVAGRFLTLCEVASNVLKRWPVSRYAAVISRFTAETGAPVVLLRPPDNSPAADMLREQPGTCAVRVVGPLPLRAVAAFLRYSAGALGNDTGLMHVAAAVGVPAVIVFGPTSARIYQPPGGHAVRSERVCEYRRDDDFDPPLCWLEERCLKGLRSCVDDVDEEHVMSALRATVYPRLEIAYLASRIA